VISLSDSIADNIAVVASVRLYEKEIGRSKHPFLIITDANSTEDEQKLHKLGADRVVTATKLLAQRINAIAVRPDMANILQEFLYRSDTPLDMEEVKVSKTSWLVLQKLKQAKLRDIANVDVIGITPKEDTFIPMPKGDTLIMPKSRLILVGTSEGIQKAKQLIRSKERPEELNYV